jgi:hypothetical protein
MSPAAFSVFVFGIYLAFVGAGFLLIPNKILPLLKFPKTKEHWIRVLGVVVGVLAFYYIIAAQNELLVFFWATIVARFAVLIGFSLLVALKKAPPMLIVFGFIDALGAVWTYLQM